MPRRDPRRSHQLELPLGKVPNLPRRPSAGPRGLAPPAGQPEWWLDDETCRVGRAGVAAARALLTGTGRRTQTAVVGGKGALASSHLEDAAA
ncbi:MAG TPA: hypothetical protein VKW77_01365 [Acidimicrobiales bacterium]|nr:hypothetical protein [Acidimicrobiales bacterium]